MRHRNATLLVTAAFLTAGLAGCGTNASSEPDTTTEPDTSTSASPTPTPTDSVTDGMAEALAQRDRFLAEQQLPTDSSMLVAVTPEQKEFIAQQREYLESQGVAWTEQHETIYLAAAVDACETAILNGHDVDAALLDAHVTSSPIFQTVLGDLEGQEREAGERNLVSIMVFGAGFICPDDAPGWEAAFDEVYGS